MEFEWDEGKRQSNLKKHGVDFIDACRIFYGCIVEYDDTRYNYGEQRFITIGEPNGRILTVVYTWRGEVRRLISARSATKNELRAYYSDYS